MRASFKGGLRMKAAKGLSVLVAVVMLAGVQSVPAMEHPMIGEEAPAYDLPTLDGGNLSSADLRGKYVVLHFGAGW